ncbi:MAG: C40 family peptidase [Ferruginibacter sp.]
MRILLFTICLFILSSCWDKDIRPADEVLQPKADVVKDTVVIPPPKPLVMPADAQHINTGSTTPEELLAFAKTLIGTPYKFASTDPVVGFDCSGFLTYVFNHFHIAVPRSSVDFTNVERTVELTAAKPGDLVLFTGTDSTNRVVGHIGIIISYENGEYNFIHSTSGKAMGVTISALSKYYFFRFVKVIRIFPQNDA